MSSLFDPSGGEGARVAPVRGEGSAPRLGESAQEEPALLVGGLRYKVILVAEDSLSLFVTRKRLENQGCLVVCTYDVRQALKRAASKGFDVVIVNLPATGADMLEVLGAMRREAAPDRSDAVPVIVISPHFDNRIHEKCRSAGLDLCVPKPYHIQELMACIKRLVRR